MREVNIVDTYLGSKRIHRDLSWLSFNERVLQEAKDKRNPLLERVKFLGIYSKNIGEFFHVRMAYHLNLVRINKSTRKRLDYSPKRLIKHIIKIANEQQLEFTRIINEEIITELKANQINLKNLESLSSHQKKFIHEYFKDTLILHVDPLLMRGKSVNPFLKDSSLYLGVLLQDKKYKSIEQEYGLIRIPSDQLPRFLELPNNGSGHDLIMLDDVVRHGLPLLFSGFKILGAYSFKMTRDAELYIDGSHSGSIKEAIKKSLKKRQTGTPARFVYDRNMPLPLLKFLTESFDLNKYDKIKEGRYQNYHDFLKFPSFNRTDLLNVPLKALNYSPLERSENIFDAIRSTDHFIHPPYHKFDAAIRFFEQASQDSDVTEIWLTQYRIGTNSKILNALIQAARNNINVTVFVEVQARFDEKSNLEWGERLEQAGVHVIYSIPGVKVHCKIGLVTRIRDGISEQYSILSTGNFHEGNSKIYSDMCIFTFDNRVSTEVDSIFNYLQNNDDQLPHFNHLLVGKRNLREALETLIDIEIAHAKNGEKAYILLKLNSLEDSRMIDKLYQANQVNVQIDLIVRGICCLIPGIVGLSENIRVISILDRYLEHARVYYFNNGGHELLYLSSADWMARNLSRRIEAAFPIFDERIKQMIIMTLHLQLKDNTKARIIDTNMSNQYVKNAQPSCQSQLAIYRMFQDQQVAELIPLTL